MLLPTTLLSLFSLTSAWILTLNLPSIPQLPQYNPSALPSSTQATLYRHGQTLTAPLSKHNSFAFADLDPGSYLLTVQCRDFAFAPTRIDVNGTFAGADGQPLSAKVDAWQTFWGNEWGNKGEWRGGGVVRAADGDVAVDIAPFRTNDYYMQRTGFSVLSFLKNPMILMGLFSLVLIVGMPMLMDSMDEETKAEFEEMQKSSPGPNMNAAQNIQNFDFAGWMAGKSTAQKAESGG